MLEVERVPVWISPNPWPQLSLEEIQIGGPIDSAIKKEGTDDAL
jgi:hypothetical protein